jgi:hypothetical protein
MAAVRTNPPVRGTQLLVEHMGDVFRCPSLIAIEIVWRWLFGIPFLLVFFVQVHRILAAFPPESSGANSIDTQNPWVAVVQLSSVVSYYEPHLLAVLRWLLPWAAIAWVVVSGFGRSLLLRRMEARLPFRPGAMIAIQAAWLALFALTVWGWFGSMQWAAATHIAVAPTDGSSSVGWVAGEPDLVGYFIWAIFLSLGFFTAFVLISWPLAIAPLLALLERRSALSALGQSLRLGKSFTGKLVEINLILGIVKLALIVVAMVFSAAPLPFSDELGPSALRFVWAASVVFFIIANDYFQAVRLKSIIEFWRVFREERSAASES